MAELPYRDGSPDSSGAQPRMASFLYRLGHLSVRRRRWVVLIWVGLLVGVGAASTAAGGTTNDSISLPATESQDATDPPDERFPATAGSPPQAKTPARRFGKEGVSQ